MILSLSGGAGRWKPLDELFEALTLIQTGKIRHSPVVLVGISHWAELLDWLGDHLVRAGDVSVDDLRLVAATDDADEVLTMIEAGYGAQASAFGPP